MPRKVWMSFKEIEARKYMEGKPRLIDVYHPDGVERVQMDSYHHRNPDPTWPDYSLTLADVARLLRKWAPADYEVGTREHVYDPKRGTEWSQPCGYMFARAPGRKIRETHLRPVVLAVTEDLFVERWVKPVIQQAGEAPYETPVA